MLHEVFYWVLNMSIIASIYGLLLYALRFVKGFPSFGSYLLWSVVLIRFLCPIGITSSFSLLNLFSKLTQKAFIKTVPIDLASQQLSLTNTIQAASSYDPFVMKTNLLENFFKVGAIIWSIVAAAAILAMTIMYFLTKSELKKAVHVTENIYTSPMVSTPTVYGIIRPKIIIPAAIAKDQLPYILAHEKVHIKRLDNIWRMAAILAACIHWFNPLIWWFLKSFLSDMELACDAAAIKKMNEEERKDYARTLLAFTKQTRTVFASAFGSSKVRIRIENILTYKKLTLFSALCFMGMGIIITLLLLTNASIK